MPFEPPPLAALPTPPSTSSPATFDSDADAFLTALPDFGTELDAAAANVYANALETATNASTATAAAATATNAATTALNAPATQATTAASITLGGGSKSFTLAQTGKAFAIGQWVLVSDPANPATRWIAGAITAFNSGTGAMTMDVAYVTGTGSGTSWAVTPIAPIIGFDASKLSTGTLPDPVFPATLPAVSGANLTNLNAGALAVGVIPGARFPNPLPAGVGVPAPQLTGDIATARMAAAFVGANSAAGYVTLPNGLILQWGNSSVSGSSSLTVTLPVAFPNSFLQAFASMDNTNTSDGNRVGAGIVSTSQIRLTNSSSTTTVRWFAIGY